MTEYIIDWDENLVIDTFSKNSLREEIVRCRDCKFCHKNYCEKRTSPTVSPSEIYWIPVDPEGFCAWAVRSDV